jgi:hypothetical protein
MLIREFAGDNSQVPKILALSQFLSKRAQDTGADPRISKASFLNLAAKMGIALSSSQLKNLSQTSPLNGVIADVTGSDTDNDGEVIFQGAESVPGADEEMTPDMARLTVDNMAKRAVDI